MPIKFKRSADKHGVPRRSTWRVVLLTEGRQTVTNRGEVGTEYIGIDDRGVEIEVITVPSGADEEVIHSMPTALRHQGEEK
jgi:hypothetical protein